MLTATATAARSLTYRHTFTGNTFTAPDVPGVFGESSRTGVWSNGSDGTIFPADTARQGAVWELVAVDGVELCSWCDAAAVVNLGTDDTACREHYAAHFTPRHRAGRHARTDGGSVSMFLLALVILASLAGAVFLAVSPAIAAPVTSSPATVRTLPACLSDDGADGQANRGCVWDSHASGNGAGRSFVIRRDAGATYGHLTYVTHRRAHLLLFGELPRR